MYTRFSVIFGAAALSAVFTQGEIDGCVDDAACAVPVRPLETVGNAMLQRHRLMTTAEVPMPDVTDLSENSQGHSLAQTVTAKVRTSVELLEEDDQEQYEEAPEEAPESDHDETHEDEHAEEHEDAHEEGEEEHEEEEDHEEISDRTAQDDAEHIETLKRIGRRIDTNNDDLLSADELHQFAKALRQKQALDKTAATFSTADSNGDGAVSLEEIRTNSIDVYTDRPDHQAARFGASDSNGDGLLSKDEMHTFLHPEVGGEVLKVEAAFQFSHLDTNGDALLDFDEFAKMGHEEDFQYEDCLEDFKLHDVNEDHFLSGVEFERLLQGHDLLHLSIKKLTDSVDTNGDGHIHVDDEVPHQLDTLLDSEFVEDYFYHQHAEHHEL